MFVGVLVEVGVALGSGVLVDTTTVRVVVGVLLGVGVLVNFTVGVAVLVR